ncbi:efflux transporter, RND family, MFP subunit [Chloroherpeton thalassium ATCC 35110]|uniref:Efflux transporter, RND family, MFP subunit n=1 Tax=Chloroherpeton thalassium (strain ATCC 35110 / GB-78) TaxID=517418 RepID=B3QYU8_CHLT3|nr:efflux RND transporter periplasmic adaptor subunit [Chloroherpeton thalassium]ACF15171.1 efflux transporter, RND family, MFP subunit [Chloroherpeton thalassium ATCC 35110]
MKYHQGLLGLVLLALTATGCGSDAPQAKNLEEIYAEKGIPVKVKPVSQTPFSVYEHYFATLSGIEESSEFAPISDKIEQVYAKVGDYVRKGQVIITFPSDNPSTQYYQLKESFENAEKTYNRLISVYEKGGVSRQDFDNAKTQFEVAKANWESIKQSIEVEAPISGIVTKINVQPSDNVEKEDELFTISKMNQLKATILVPEKHIVLYEVGQKAIARWNGKELQGKVTRVNRTITPQKQAFEVKLAFDNPGVIFQTGITADVDVEVYEKAAALAINRSNLIERQNQHWVFIAQGDSALLKPVALGKSNGVKVEITEGLTPGEKLITEGQLLLSQGKKINIQN